MFEILMWIGYILVGVPLAFIALVIVSVFVGAAGYCLFNVWWMILYLVTFSWKTNLIPKPPESSDDGW